MKSSKKAFVLQLSLLLAFVLLLSSCSGSKKTIFKLMNGGEISFSSTSKTEFSIDVTGLSQDIKYVKTSSPDGGLSCKEAAGFGIENSDTESILIKPNQAFKYTLSDIKSGVITLEFIADNGANELMEIELSKPDNAGDGVIKVLNHIKMLEDNSTSKLELYTN